MDFFELTAEGLAGKLGQMGIKTPTEVQAAAIPAIKEGRDVVVQSATGTGKTLAYLLPLFAGFTRDIKGVQAVVLAPTYELAGQITNVARSLADRPADAALIIGGANKARQAEALKAKPKIVIGTAGRILEHVADRKLSMHHVGALVFDEADRLFFAENIEPLAKLVKTTLAQRQILLFSSSITEAVLGLALPLMKPEPAIIRQGGSVPQNIDHYYILSPRREKFEHLRRAIHALDARGIVFVNKPFTIERVCQRLNFHKLGAVPLFGAAQMDKRKQALDAFRAGSARLLVASDIGSRGLDVAGLNCIINLDMPESAADYLHRAGRCGRMGSKGAVVSIVTEAEAAVLKKFAAGLDIVAAEKVVVRGKMREGRHGK